MPPEDDKNNPIEDNNEPSTAVQVKGAAKIVGGLASLAATSILFPVGLTTLAIGAASTLAGAAAQVWGSEDWQEWGKKAVGYGIQAMIYGGIAATPFAPCITLCTEGLYNAVKGQDAYGIVPFARMAARTLTGIPQPGDPYYEKYQREKLFGKQQNPPEPDVPERVNQPQRAAQPKVQFNMSTLEKNGNQWQIKDEQGKLYNAIQNNGKWEFEPKQSTSDQIRVNGFGNGYPPSSVPNNRPQKSREI